ncbi:MAG: orotidine-5'-phosphate decarboxylase [Bowdeniella nasicola]|nr:orotidine-5'-phosphate decarboxylase [Bowdeniella nasicola]
MTNAGMRLAARMDTFGPLCVGIDPHPQLLAAWQLEDTVAGLRAFSEICVEELVGTCAAIKPQVAFFERFGPPGMQVLAELLTGASELGHFTIADAKRGDIGSTMAGYGAAYLSADAPFPCDALTVNPYLGVGALAPAIELALSNDKALFVLALTSNPQGASVQHCGGDDAVAKRVIDELAAYNRDICASSGHPIGPLGTVVGATVGDAPRKLGIDLAAFNGIHLAPGVGAQGADAASCRRVFGNARMLASVSRAVLRAGPGKLAAAAREFGTSLTSA